MTNLISEILSKIDRLLNKKFINNQKLPIIKAAISGIIVGLISVAIGTLLIPNYDSWGIWKALKNTLLSILVFLPLGLSFQVAKDNKINGLVESIEEIENDVCETSLLGLDFQKDLEEQNIDDSLAATASIDISKLSLEELKQVINYLEDFIPKSEDEEDEFGEEPFVKGYKPNGDPEKSGIDKSYKL